MIGSSDSDSEDDKRVIRSAKDRRFDELQATCHEIRVSKPSKCAAHVLLTKVAMGSVLPGMTDKFNSIQLLTSAQPSMTCVRVVATSYSMWLNMCPCCAEQGQHQ